MKKMFGIVFLLLFLYIIAQIIYSFVVGKHTITYQLMIDKNLYSVKEVFNSRHVTDNNKESDKSSYYYEISDKDYKNVLFNFKLVGDYSGTKHFLEDMRVYKNDNVLCIYPVYHDKNIHSNIICRENDQQFLYVKGQNVNLDSFIMSLETEGYSHYAWNNNPPSSINYGNLIIYDKNIIDKQYIAVWNYKSIYDISKGSKHIIGLLGEDHYDNSLNALINGYYIIPDYSSGIVNFSNFIRVNLNDTTISNIRFPFRISYDSFIQGVIGDSFYLIDKENKVQYKVNAMSSEVTLIGNQNTAGRVYHNGKWGYQSILDIINNHVLFSDDIKTPASLQLNNLIRIDKTLGDTDGYYYLYTKEGNNTAIYRADRQNINMTTLLFKIPSLSNIKYIDNSIYFISGDTLYMYSDELGLRPLIKDNEFKFNHSNMYDVYINKNQL